MNTMITIFLQIVYMFILSGIGYLMYKLGKITVEGSKAIGNILIYLSLPCVIINSFLVERTPEKVTELALSALIAALILGISIWLSRVFMKKSAIDNFSASFSNPGFFGIPLITASLGNGSVFYVAAFIALVNLLQWSYGVNLLESSDENGNLNENRTFSTHQFNILIINLMKRLIKAPFMIAILIGLALFFSGITLPSIPKNCINGIAALNTPLAMFTIGIYMAQTKILKMFTRPKLYLLSLVRLIIIPAATLGVLLIIPSSMLEMKLALLIVSACPVGSNVAVYAQLHNRDYAYAVETVVISTLFSVFSIPLIVGLAGLIFT